MPNKVQSLGVVGVGVPAAVPRAWRIVVADALSWVDGDPGRFIF